MMTWINHSILHAVLQLDANGSVTKHVKMLQSDRATLEQIPDRLAIRPPVRDGRATPN